MVNSHAISTQEAQLLPLPKAKLGEIGDIQQILSACNSIVLCPDKQCGFIFERAEELPVIEPGMSAKQYFELFRFRCRKCDVDFCSGCSVMPYHHGYSCESFKRKEACEERECEFCEETLSECIPSHQNYCNNCFSEAQSCSRLEFPCQHTNHFHKNFEENSVCLNSSCLSGQTMQLDDYCAICGIEPLRRNPVVQLIGCHHVFHQSCLEKRFTTETSPISITSHTCPLCSSRIENGVSSILLENAMQLREDIAFRIPPLLKEYDISISNYVDDDIVISEGLKKINFYTCFGCKGIYFGGLRECGEEIDFPAEELLCGGCRGCDKHGSEHMVYKCKFCCSIATFFCFGHTHFCTPCHDNAWGFVQGNQYHRIKGKEIKTCEGKEVCPLGILHPPNGEEFAIGCSACNDTNMSGIEYSSQEEEKKERRNIAHHNQEAEGRIVEEAKIKDDFAARKQKKVKPLQAHVFHFLPKPEYQVVRAVRGSKRVSARIEFLMEHLEEGD